MGTLRIVFQNCFLVIGFVLIYCFSLGEIQTPMKQLFITWDTKKLVNPRPLTQKGIPGPNWTHLNKLRNVLNKNTDYRFDVNEPGFNLTDEEKLKFKIWPLGVIPYFIDDFSFDKVLRDRIRSFLDLINLTTGLIFMELPSPPADKSTRWVFFLNRRGLLGCIDHTTSSFTNEGVQKVILGYDCMSTSGGLSKAVLALAGVPPQHNSPNRHNYIIIQEENIIPDKIHLFDMLDNEDWLFHDVPYDYESAGHYHWHEYSATGKATIVPTLNIEYPVGETNELSRSDLWKIRMLYNYDQRNNKAASNIKGAECSKIFKPGPNFSSYQPTSDDELPPRPKPARYLGVIEDVPLSNENSGDSAQELALKYSENEAKGSEVYRGNPVNSSGDSSADKAVKKKLYANWRVNKKYKARPMGLKKSQWNPITNLSDYDTAERHKRLVDKYFSHKSEYPISDK